MKIKNKTKMIAARVTEHELKLIAKAAQAVGLRKSSFLRFCIMREVHPSTIK